MARQNSAGARHGWQGAGRDGQGTGGPGCVLAVAPHRVAPLLPSRRFPGGADRNQRQFFSLSIPRVTSLTAGPGKADPAGMAAPENLPTRGTWTPEKIPNEPGHWGGAQPQHPTAAPRAQFLGDPSLLVPSRHPQHCRGGPSPVGVPRKSEWSPRAPPPGTRKPQCSPMCTDFSLYSTRNQPQKNHIKGLLGATANGNISPGTAAAESAELKANRQRARLRWGTPCPPVQPAGTPSPPARTPPPSPGTVGVAVSPTPGKHRGWDGSSPCVSLSINTRGDAAWLSPTPLPPREVTGAPPRPRGHPPAFPPSSP